MGNRLPDSVSTVFSDPWADINRSRPSVTPLLEDLARTQSIALGLEQIFKLALENDLGGEPRLPAATIDGLLGLGKAVSVLISPEY
jgi:hypothetical protein